MKQEGSKKSWIWGKNSRPKRWIQYCRKQNADLFFQGFREHSRVKTFNFILLNILLFSIFVANNRLAIFVGSNWKFKRKNYFLENSFLFTQIKNNWFYPWYPIARSAAKECCWKQQKEHVDQKHDVVFINKKEKYFQNKKLVFRVFVHELNSWKWSNSGNIHDWKKLRQKLCFQFIQVFSNHLFRFFFCASFLCR